MATTLELMKADRVDEQGDLFTVAALKGIAAAYLKNPKLHRFVTMGFSPQAKPIEGVTGIIYSCGALLVTLEGEAEKVAKAEGLAVAAGGYMDIPKEIDGVRTYEFFNLDRIALVDPKKKIG